MKEFDDIELNFRVEMLTQYFQKTSFPSLNSGFASFSFALNDGPQ